MTGPQLQNNMVDQHRAPPYQVPHRKPLPGGKSPGVPPYAGIPAPQQPQLQNQHSRTRTTSSNVFPTITPSATFSSQGQPSPPLAGNFAANRRLSTATTSTTSTGGHGVTRTATNMSGSIRRSTSSRSSSSPTSYVALMRKQKGTVWCDRSQHEDPRLLAQQKAAKMRATLEVHGGNATGSGRTSTIGSGSMVGKIRHHGVPKAPGYVPVNLSGAGVPIRLSATEVGVAEEEVDDGDSGRLHTTTGSGRSSLGSSRFPSGYQRPQGRFSSGSTPPSGGGSPGDIPEAQETPVPSDTKKNGDDYFNAPGGNGESAGSGDREDSFGNITDMAGPSAVVKQIDSAKKADELRRRGSVDDRAMTMSGVRLFVANPDLDD